MAEAKKLIPKRRFKEFQNAGEWEQRKLGEIGDFKNGMNFTKDAMGHGYPFVNLQDVFGKSIVDPSNLGKANCNEKQRKEYNLLEGDVLFIRSSVKLEGVGEAAIIPKTLEDTTYSGFIIRFRPKIKMNNDFNSIIYSSPTIRGQIMANATSSANTNINQDSLSNIEIVLPTIDEQSKIGLHFKKLDNLIILQQRKLEKIKSMKKAYLYEMFPAEGESKPKRRFKGFTDDWEQRKLETIYNKIRNAFVGTATPYYVEEGNFYLESNNVKDGQINRKTEIFINDEFYLKQKDNWLQTGDIAMVQSGHVGHAAVIPKELNNTAAHALIIFSSPKIEVNPYFLNYQYQTMSYKKAIDKITTGNTIKHILSSDMKEFTVSWTNIGEQNKIADFFVELDNLITLHQSKLDKLKNLKKAYLNEMFI